MGLPLRRVPGLLAVLAAAGFLLLGHPAGAAFADTGRAIAASSSATLRAVGALGVVDAAAPAAAAILLAAALAVGAVGSGLLAGPSRPEGTRDGRVPSAALLAQVAGILAVALGGRGPAFYGAAGAVAAAILLRPGPAPGPRPAPWRAGLLVLCGALLFLAAGGIDGLLHAALPARPIPEAWFVLAAESGGGVTVPVVLAFAALVLAAAGMESAAGRGPGLPVAAASWALLLGPSNPGRALALAWSLRCMARAGLPPAARAAFAAALVAGMALLVYA